MATTKSRTLPLSKRGLNFEMLMWLFTRLSALAMYALILFAIIGALIMGARQQMSFADMLRWGFMPNVTHVQDTNVPDTTPGRRLLETDRQRPAAGRHGTWCTWLVVIADDYIVSSRGRLIVRWLSIIMMTGMSFIGVYVIWTS